jgi:hypothetical protein
MLVFGFGEGELLLELVFFLSLLEEFSLEKGFFMIDSY